MNEIEKALKDIAEMKKAIKNNVAIIRPIFFEKRLITLSLYSAFFCIVYFSTMEWVKYTYTTFASIPLWLTIIYIVCATLFIGFTGFYKIYIINTDLKKRSSGVSFFDIVFLREFRTYFLDISVLFVIFVMISFFVIFPSGQFWLVLPAAYILMGIMLLMAAELFYLPLYRVQGVCTACIGIIMLCLMKNMYFLWLAGSLFAFFIIFAIIILISQKKDI